MGIVSFVITLIGLFFNPYALFSIIGIVLGSVELWNQNNKENSDKIIQGLSLTGIILGVREFVYFFVVICSIRWI